MSLLRHHQLLMKSSGVPTIPVLPDTWYDASDASSITESGGLVSEWRDKSGNGYHATASDLNRPTTDSGYVRFYNGTGGPNTNPSTLQRLLASSYPHAFGSVYVVVQNMIQRSTPMQSGVVFCSASTIPHETEYHGVVIRYDSLSSAGTLLRHGTIYHAELNTGWTGGVRKMIRSRFISSTLIDVRVNGVGAIATSSAATKPSGALFIGTERVGSSTYPAGGLSGDINEICIYHSVLSESDDAAVSAYLMTKWGIS